MSDTPDSHIKALQDLDRKVHQMMIEASRNNFIYKQYDNLRCLFNMGIYVGENNVAVAKREHMDIMESIYNGQKEDAHKCGLPSILKG